MDNTILLLLLLEVDFKETLKEIDRRSNRSENNITQ
jgi:hypothetical protein